MKAERKFIGLKTIFPQDDDFCMKYFNVQSLLTSSLNNLVLLTVESINAVFQ